MHANECMHASQVTQNGHAQVTLTRGQLVKCKGRTDSLTFVVGVSLMGKDDVLFSFMALTRQSCTRGGPSFDQREEVHPVLEPLTSIVEIEPRAGDIDHVSWQTLYVYLHKHACVMIAYFVHSFDIASPFLASRLGTVSKKDTDGDEEATPTNSNEAANRHVHKLTKARKGEAAKANKPKARTAKEAKAAAEPVATEEAATEAKAATTKAAKPAKPAKAAKAAKATNAAKAAEAARADEEARMKVASETAKKAAEEEASKRVQAEADREAAKKLAEERAALAASSESANAAVGYMKCRQCGGQDRVKIFLKETSIVKSGTGTRHSGSGMCINGHSIGGMYSLYPGPDPQSHVESLDDSLADGATLRSCACTWWL